MIHAVLIFNNHGKSTHFFIYHDTIKLKITGKPRLSKFFTLIPPLIQQSLISQIFSLISDRPQGVCNFLDAPELVFPTPGMSKEREEEASRERKSNGKRKLVGGDDDTRVIYRHYATLYFVYVLFFFVGNTADVRFVVDGAESELGILDLIQVCPVQASGYYPCVY
jgi:AP-3 complex subunit sigma